MNLSLFDRYRDVLIDDWGAFTASLARPLPICIWTNSLRTTPEDLLYWLRREGWETTPVPWLPGAFRLPADIGPGRSPAYLTGLYHVQEEVSVLPVHLLDPQPGERILDLCAAPGGKTLRTAVQMRNQGTVVANDLNRHRIGVLLRNVERLGLTNVVTTVYDAGNLPRAMGSFDRVLVDVPCGCEGTVRKNPEVLDRPGYNHRTTSHLAILRKAIQLCRPGGRIVYSTCTFAPEENEMILDEVLRTSPPGLLTLKPARVPGVVSLPGLSRWQESDFSADLTKAMRVYPHHNDTGGFFVAVLEKSSEAPDLEAATTSTWITQHPWRDSASPGPPQKPPRDQPLDPSPWLEPINRRFGFPEDLFADGVFFRPNSRHVHMIHSSAELPGRPEPTAMGLPVFYLKGRSPRLTTAATVAFGRSATRNLVELERAQIAPFLHRQELELAARQIATHTTPGPVIVMHCGFVLGSGDLRREDEEIGTDSEFRLRGVLPRSWAARISDGKSARISDGMSARS